MFADIVHIGASAPSLRLRVLGVSAPSQPRESREGNRGPLEHQWIAWPIRSQRTPAAIQVAGLTRSSQLPEKCHDQ
jgi:hypothetical protein